MGRREGRDDGPKGKSRTLVEAKARLIAEALRKGRPLHLALIGVLGDCPSNLVPEEERKAATITLREHAARWLEEIKATERKSYVRKATSCTSNVILPFFGNMILSDVTTERVFAFKDHVLARTRQRRDAATGELVSVPITAKTARNIVTGFFRAIIVAAMERHRVPSPDPFPLELRFVRRRGAARWSQASEPRRRSLHRRGARQNPRLVPPQRPLLVPVPLLPVLDRLPPERDDRAARG